MILDIGYSNINHNLPVDVFQKQNYKVEIIDYTSKAKAHNYFRTDVKFYKGLYKNTQAYVR